MRFYQIWFWSYFESTQTHSKIRNLTMQIIHHWTILAIETRKMGQESGRYWRLKVDGKPTWEGMGVIRTHWTVKVLSTSGLRFFKYQGRPLRQMTGHIPLNSTWLFILMKMTVQIGYWQRVLTVCFCWPSTLTSSLKWPSFKLQWT